MTGERLAAHWTRLKDGVLGKQGRRRLGSQLDLVPTRPLDVSEACYQVERSCWGPCRGKQLKTVHHRNCLCVYVCVCALREPSAAELCKGAMHLWWVSWILAACLLVGIAAPG
jgi:hypothetical protein